jgi:septum site-determining protein MinC
MRPFAAGQQPVSCKRPPDKCDIVAEIVLLPDVAEGLLLTVKPGGAEWLDLMTSLFSRIDQQAAFYKGARVALDVGSRPLRPFELDSLKAGLARRSMTLWAVVSDSATTNTTARNMRLETSLVADAEQMEVMETDPEETGTPGIIIDHTLRSGRTVRNNGNVIVIGNVNPGAEIVAGGNVIVWGKLRGRVHAGANGDESAVICALDLAPTQLRIANFITTSPEDKRRKPRPETASVRQGRIIAEVWNE